MLESIRTKELKEKAQKIFKMKMESGEIDVKKPVHELNMEYKKIENILGIGR